MPNPPVGLHVASDATGETAARLVQALEAQFPEQDFVEIRHPRVESQDDLQLAVNRMRGRPAVVVYTLVQPQLREAMRTLCRRARLHYCDLLGQPIDAVARVSGQAATMTPGSRPQPPVRRARRDLRGARAGEEAPPPAPLPRHRHLRAVDRGDGAPHPPRRRGARRRDEGTGGPVTAKPRIPLWRWAVWWLALLIGDFLFYVLLTPVWI